MSTLMLQRSLRHGQELKTCWEVRDEEHTGNFTRPVHHQHACDHPMLAFDWVASCVFECSARIVVHSGSQFMVVLRVHGSSMF